MSQPLELSRYVVACAIYLCKAAGDLLCRCLRAGGWKRLCNVPTADSQRFEVSAGRGHKKSRGPPKARHWVLAFTRPCCRCTYESLLSTSLRLVGPRLADVKPQRRITSRQQFNTYREAIALRALLGDAQFMAHCNGELSIRSVPATTEAHDATEAQSTNS